MNRTHEEWFSAVMRNDRGHGWTRILILSLLAWCICETRLPAQSADQTADAPASASQPSMTVDQIKELQSRAAAIPELSDELKARVAELSQQAIADVQAEETFKKEAAQSAAQMQAIPQSLATTEEELAKLEKASEPEVSASATISELETELQATQQRITELEQQLTLPTADPAVRTARRQAARAFLVDLPNQLQEVKQKQEAPPPEGEPSEVTQLRSSALAARRQSLLERANAAQAELALFDAEDTAKLPTLRRELLTRRLSRRRKQVEMLSGQINKLRQQEAAQRVKEARLAVLRAQPLMKPILEANEQIAREEAKVRQEHDALQKSSQDRQRQLSELREDFQEIQSLDEQFGLTPSVGLRLRKLRLQLPNLRYHESQQRERYEVLESAQFTLYERLDALRQLDDIEAIAEEIVASSSNLSEQQKSQLNEDALNALRTQHDYLDKVVSAYRNYTETLTRLDLQEQQLIDVTREFASFIDERILWVRSHRPIKAAEVIADRQSVAWLGDRGLWSLLVQRLVADARSVPLIYLAAGSVLVSLVVIYRRMGRQFHEVKKSAQSRVSVSVFPTLRAAQFTILAAMTWPALMWFVAWRLWQSPDPPRIVLATAVTLSRLAGIFLILELVRQSMRPHGLCEAHFGCGGSTARRVRQRLRQLMVLGMPIAAAAAIVHFYDMDGRNAFVERLLFMAAMLVLTFVAHGLLHPDRGDLRELRSAKSDGWIERLGLLWYLLGIGLPLALAGLAAAGYYYTAQRLAIRCEVSLCVLLGVLYLRAFLLRWLMLRHRRLRLQQLRERQASQQTPSSHEAPLPEVATEEADLDTISKQSQRMVNTTFAAACLIGAWMIWFDVVPALRFLDRWPIWEYTAQVTETITSDKGGSTVAPREVTVPVTIAHLALAALILVLTMTAARNLPGLLEITLIERLPLDRSTVYAATAIVRYSLVLIGILMTSRTLGIGWSKVQWLAAALTFGLGFGLQEIFANFVSGIIILFEQPVRVGDVVTIDGVSGVVNRIRIRATTITDWDRKEYIVPNREFITGRLLNWTLADKVNRLLVNVCVPYGSDTDRVREIILSTAQEHEHVLTDPPPLVTLEAFGENGLNFVLRAYLPNLECRLQTINDLHVEVERRLRKAGIAIPLPQRDLHVRTQGAVTSDPRTSSHRPVDTKVREAARN